MTALLSRLRVLILVCLPFGQVVAAPGVDHHQHLFSPAIIALLAPPPGPDQLRELPAHALIAHLDAAGIRRATVLSVAYMFGSPARQVADEYAKVRAENDWTAAQAGRYPDRMRAFCGFNPLKDYALRELERCAAHPGLRHGIKLHFGNSDVQLDKAEHIARLQEVFRAANRHRMAIVLHLRASVSLKRPYGAAQARALLEQLMPLATDIPVQVAHFAGTGSGYVDPAANEVMRVFAEAAATPGRLAPREAWAAFRALPLTPDDVRRIAANTIPTMKQAAVLSSRHASIQYRPARIPPRTR